MRWHRHTMTGPEWYGVIEYCSKNTTQIYISYVCVGSITMCMTLQIQVAEWWAEQKYQDFAAIPQPFFSGAIAANATIDFLSDVSMQQFFIISSVIATSLSLSLHTYTSTYLYTAAGLLSPLPDSPPKHGQGSLEQHAHSSRQ